MSDLACGHEKWDTPWNGKRRQKMRNTQLHIAIEAMVFLNSTLNRGQMRIHIVTPGAEASPRSPP